jgi:hypothetical protein
MHGRELLALQLMAVGFGLPPNFVRQRSDFLSQSPLYATASARNKSIQESKHARRSRRKAVKSARKRNRPQ